VAVLVEVQMLQGLMEGQGAGVLDQELQDHKSQIMFLHLNMEIAVEVLRGLQLTAVVVVINAMWEEEVEAEELLGHILLLLRQVVLLETVEMV
jgi:predicted outer membrane lipoprotein